MKIHQKKNIRWNGIVRREVKEKEYFSKILNGSASYMDLTAALEKLSKMLAIYYRVAPIIINEYDTPIQEGYSKDFYNEIINFMRVFFWKRSRITGICHMDFLQASCELHRRAFSAD